MSSPDNTSIWKKEISLKRKPKPATAEATSTAHAAASEKKAEPSVWKKEIGFKRKQKPAAAAVTSTGRAATPDKKAEPSVWKKEVSFRRKPKPASAPAAVAPVAPVVGAVASEKKAEPSVWKKEIGFKRKQKPAAAAVTSTGRAATPDKKAEPSVWKKEVSFRRKPKPASAPAAVAPVAPVVGAVASEKKAEPSVWKKEISFKRKPKAEPAVPVEPVTPMPEPAHSQPEPRVSWPQSPPVASEEPVLPPVSPPAAMPVPPPVSPPVPPMTPPLSPEPGPREPETIEVVPDVAAYVPIVAAEAMQVEREVEPVPAAADVPDPVHVPAPEPAPVAEAPSAPAPVPAAEEKKQSKDERKDKGTHNQLVGLKIGASQIAAAQVINKGEPRIVRMARQPLERGVVVGGELREPDELASVLKAFFRANKLPKNCVRLGISNNRIGVRTFEITGIEDPKQLANAVRFRAQETLPIPLDEAALDYRILEDKIGEDGVRVCRVLLVVAHKELVERYVAACRKAGLKLVGIDLEAFALLRALSDPTQPPGEDAAVVCVSIGHDRSTLAVSDGRICEFTRVLAWGGSALDSALARVLDLTPLQVTPIKHALSLDEEGEAAGLDAVQADEARRAMAAELQSFARELVASLRFYQEQPNSLGIVEILITGGAAAGGGLAAELQRLIGIPVRVADPLGRVKMPRKLEYGGGSPTSLAVAVGLGIED